MLVPRYKLFLCHTPIKLDLLGFLGISVFEYGLRDHVITRFASIMSMSLTPETFNITSMFRLSFRFTFGTSRDINFSLWWFGSKRNKGPQLDSTLSF